MGFLKPDNHIYQTDISDKTSSAMLKISQVIQISYHFVQISDCWMLDQP